MSNESAARSFAEKQAERCPTCGGSGRLEMLEHCPDCRKPSNVRSSISDAEFIAAARTALPELIAELTALRGTEVEVGRLAVQQCLVLEKSLKREQERNTALRERLVWRPIETAPKDGADFLACWNDHDELHVVCIRGDKCYRAMDREPWAMPSMWLPLPEPPAAKE